MWKRQTIFNLEQILEKREIFEQNLKTLMFFQNRNIFEKNGTFSETQNKNLKSEQLLHMWTIYETMNKIRERQAFYEYHELSLNLRTKFEKPGTFLNF